LIKELESLLQSPKKMRLAVENELMAVKQTYGDRRKTQIVSLREGESAKLLLTANDLTPAQEVWVGVMEDGHIARTHNNELPRVSGRAAPQWLVKTNTHHTLYLVTDQGKTAAVSVETLPVKEKFAEGSLLSKVAPLEEEDPLAALFSLPPRDEIQGDKFIITVSRFGMVKKSAVTELPGPSSQSFLLAKVNPGDFLGWAVLTSGDSDLMLVTSGGMAIRFAEQEVRPMGLAAAGVNGIKLDTRDEVVGVEKIVKEAEVLLVASNGQAWRMPSEDFPVQGRYGQGVIACRPGRGVKVVGEMSGKKTQAGTVHFERAASQNIRMDEIPLGKRAATSKATIPVKAGDAVIQLTFALDGLAFWSAKPAIERKPRAKKAKAEEG
jgi:DNA gyrase subunit A